VFSLLAILVLTFTRPASAFDGRSGENIVIKSDEVIDDDLYVTAGTFVLDGTVNGDLIVVGQTLTINGKVDGDVMAAGQPPPRLNRLLNRCGSGGQLPVSQAYAIQSS